MVKKIILLITAIWLTDLTAQPDQRFWIFFRDKGPEPAAVNPALSGYAISKRIQKNIAVNDFFDRPVSSAYIDALVSSGIEIHRQSRWMNAVSAGLKGLPPETVRSLPFVAHVRPVGIFRRKPEISAGTTFLPKSTSPAYGPSDNQVRMLGIPEMHELGITGKGVRIALFDTGFRLDHESLRHISVIDSYDFINNDTNVDNEPGDYPTQYHHGTRVLSVIGGYHPGFLIGPAYDSEYLLAKTEDISGETHMEEDNWVAAAEWADSLGADIISSSLGYSVFDAGEGDYTYQDMNGSTAIITRAADMAVAKGIAVFTSAGNEGTGDWYYITAPADGFNVIAVGGLNPDGLLWNPSSRGPTSDGRIKPEMVAQAGSVFNVEPASTAGYSVASGTSLACPLAAGSGALLLSINPNMDPLELRALLINSATQALQPDNNTGYGRIDLVKALGLLSANPAVEISELTVTNESDRILISWIAYMEIANGYWSVLRKAGQQPREELARIEGRAFGLHPERYVVMDNDFRGGEEMQYIVTAHPGDAGTVDLDSARITIPASDRYDLRAAYPNPFNSRTTITMSLIRPSRISLEIYDISGQRIRTMISDEPVEPGYHRYIWNGENDHGVTVSSGVYLVVAWDGSQLKSRKVILLR